MEKYLIEVPFFCGFYESPLYYSDMTYYEFNDDDNLEYYRERFEDETLTPDDLDIDFQKYCKDASVMFVEAFNNYAPDFVLDAKFDELVSPKYYNYSTDKIYAEIELADDWKENIHSFMNDNKEWLTDRIKKEWSDRDGFWSFMPNDYQEWYDEFSKDNVDERFISAMIGYIMYLNNKGISEWLITDVLENTYIGEYVINIKEEKSA